MSPETPLQDRLQYKSAGLFFVEGLVLVGTFLGVRFTWLNKHATSFLSRIHLASQREWGLPSPFSLFHMLYSTGLGLIENAIWLAVNLRFAEGCSYSSYDMSHRGYYSTSQQKGLTANQGVCAPETKAVLNEVLQFVTAPRHRMYKQVASLHRVNMKIPGMSPEDLPVDTMQNVSRLLERHGLKVVQHYVRAGCIQVILELTPLSSGATSAGPSTSQGTLEVTSPSGSRVLSGERDASDSSLESLSFDSSSTWNFNGSTASSSDSLPIVTFPPNLRGAVVPGRTQPKLPAFGTSTFQNIMDKLPPGFFVNLLGVEEVTRAEVLVQTMDSAVFVRNGLVTSNAQLNSHPCLLSTSPVCLYHGLDSMRSKATVLLSGHNLLEEGVNYCVRSHGRFLKSEVVSSTVLSCFGMRPDRNLVELHVEGLPTCGLLRIECQKSGILSSWRPLLAVDDMRIVDELSTLDHHLQQADAMDIRDSISEFLTDLGLWLESEQAGSLAALPLPQQLVMACRLVEFCLDNGWGVTANRVMDHVFNCILPSHTAEQERTQTSLYSDCMTLTPIDEPDEDQFGSTVSEPRVPCVQPTQPLYCVIHTLSLAISTDGLSLLHKAVRSGKWDAVDVVLSWADRGGFSRGDAWCSPGPNGITPLHLAAILHDDGNLAWSCLANCEAARQLWTQVAACDGRTPADFAREVGRYNLSSSAPPATVQNSELAVAEYLSATEAPPSESGRVPRVESDNATPVPIPAPTTASWSTCFAYSLSLFPPALERQYLIYKAYEALNWDCPYLAFVTGATLLSAGRSAVDGQYTDLPVLVGFMSGLLFVYAVMFYNRGVYCQFREPLMVFMMLWRAALFGLFVLGWCTTPRQYLAYVASWEYLLVDGTIAGYFNQVRVHASVGACLGALVDLALLVRFLGFGCARAVWQFVLAVSLSCGVNLLRDVQSRYAFLRYLEGQPAL